MSTKHRNIWGFAIVMRHRDTTSTKLFMYVGNTLVRVALLAVSVVGLTFCACSAQAADGQIQLKVVGGLAGVSQYTKLEEPFWTQQVPELTQGRVQAEIHPFDRSGLPGQEMLQLMRLGVVPFGTALLALVSGDEPELNAVDLPTLNPDMATLRRTVELYRTQLHDTLQEKYGIELLGIYAYPAQVLYCAQSFKRLLTLPAARYEPRRWASRR